MKCDLIESNITKRNIRKGIHMNKTMKKLRKKNGISQKELADLVGTSQSAISNYENGNRKLNIETAQKIAIALEISLDELWNGIVVDNEESLNNRTINEDVWDIYEELLKQGKIEIYDYDSQILDNKKKFLEIWKLIMGSEYEESDLTIYIGQPGKPGRFYECYEDFFLRNEGEEKSDFECLIEEILKENQ